MLFAFRSALAVACSLAVAATGMPIAAQGSPARLEGTIVGLDGEAAAGLEVVLLAEGGAEVASARTDQAGTYVFTEVPPGLYGLGLVLADGTAVRVPIEDIELLPGEIARRDLQLVPSARSEAPPPLEPPPVTAGKTELWWAGLSPTMKGVVIGGGVAAVALIAVVLFDDDDEPQASPF